MRECLPGYAKGVHGLCVPSQSCINIEKDIAYEASAAAFGSEFPPAESGEVWKWDMKKGVHMYLKKMYCDIKLDRQRNKKEQTVRSGRYRRCSTDEPTWSHRDSLWFEDCG
jgi:hypothetical protein